MNGEQRSPLIESGEWRKESRELLNTPTLVSKPYLTRVSKALEAVNQAQVTPPRPLMEGEKRYKDAIYDTMDTYPSQQDLAVFYGTTERDG
ncbi:hypothetical protein PIROE2DRAFT_18896 [Piromyces sp. E2]|nr:hypothetical protein PIROE2DRAFT_18896 [Piromyces sp. E2]|eukprot:OUM56487.1 hypothetical protein PIROE2DRAFT_18896 [Piromyces sp. E2]